jgi:hypothetical protein
VDIDPELAHKNTMTGIVLFAIALLIFGATVGIGLLYLHFD